MSTALQGAVREEEEEVLLGHEMGTQAHEEEGHYPLVTGVGGGN